MTLAIGATREGTDAAKASALVFDGGSAIMLAPNMSPANCAQAAREILGTAVEFSHLSAGYPIYRQAP